MTGNIRLGCRNCDTDECDFISEIPTTWADVEEVQSFSDSLKEIAVDDKTGSPFEWYTHLGICPACQELDKSGCSADESDD